MKQDNRMTQALTRAQETRADIARQYAYRIHVSHERPTTEHGDTAISTVRAFVAAIVCRFVKGATLIPAIGVLQGGVEHATIVEVVALSSDAARIHDIASALRCAFGQSIVLVTHAPVQAEWVRAEDQAHG